MAYAVSIGQQLRSKRKRTRDACTNALVPGPGYAILCGLSLSPGTRPASSSAVTVSILTGPSRWGQAPGRSAAHGRSLAGPVDPARIPPLALDPYRVEQRYHRQHLRIFDVSIFVILDACLRPDQCWGVRGGLCGAAPAGREVPTDDAGRAVVRARGARANHLYGAGPGVGPPASSSCC